jgi:hypothetical protein
VIGGRTASTSQSSVDVKATTGVVVVDVEATTGALDPTGLTEFLDCDVKLGIDETIDETRSSFSLLANFFETLFTAPLSSIIPTSFAIESKLAPKTNGLDTQKDETDLPTSTHTKTLMYRAVLLATVMLAPISVVYLVVSNSWKASSCFLSDITSRMSRIGLKK